MLTATKETSAGIEVVKAIGTVSKSDYEAVVVPLVDGARQSGHRLRVMCEIGPEFRSFTPAAAWEDLKVGPGAVRLCDGCAVVSDAGWIRGTTHVLRFLMPCPVRVFAAREREAALQWLASLPEGPGVSHRLLTDSQVLVVEAQHPLRAQDFEALATTADGWLRTHDALAGLVIRTRVFPGWENLNGLIRHVQFIHDHHRRIERIAVAGDSKITALAPHLANRFVHAQVRHFAYDALDDALAWAAGPGAP
ncbi:STAS/SEC14 domain-containing protein [Streptomyces noursei]